MSTEEKDSIEIEIQSEENPPEEESKNELSIEELQTILEEEQKKLSSCQDKLQRSLADYQNLEKKTTSDIENGVNLKIDKFLQNFLSIYDDFVRAKTVLSEEKANIEGIASILKNIDSLLAEYKVAPIDALGEIFDPNIHEAVSVVEDPNLDDGTITKEIRKGYISQNRVIRPAIVEISKKSKPKESESE